MGKKMNTEDKYSLIKQTLPENKRCDLVENTPEYKYIIYKNLINIKKIYRFYIHLKSEQK